MTNTNYPAQQRVAVIVPLSARDELTSEELISLSHLTHFLGRFDKYFVLPECNRLQREGYQRAVFPDRFFGSVAANTQLMLSKELYSRFSHYEYLLIYHLDALVFSDQLLSWCEMGYDYIGAPWLVSEETPEEGFSGVGNGGFCLRRVQAMLDLIDSSVYAINPADYWQKHFGDQPLAVRLRNYPRRFLKRLRIFNNARREIAHISMNEDRYCAQRARHFNPEFNFAPIDVALQFAFECAPRFCFEQNGGQLPFGCHAWDKIDREFWEPHLLPAATAGVGA